MVVNNSVSSRVLSALVKVRLVDGSGNVRLMYSGSSIAPTPPMFLDKP